MKKAAPTVPTVLVVDDDPEWLNFLCKIIGSEYPVLSATNGEDAIRRTHNACPDVIILDVIMHGGRDGFSIYAELQSDPRTQDIPVLMFSKVNRKTGMEEMNRYLGKAPAAFLEKPIFADRLLAEVRKALLNLNPAVAGSDW